MEISRGTKALYYSFACGAIALLLDEGRLEFDVWLYLDDDKNINIYSNGEVITATIFPVIDGVVQTDTGTEVEIYRLELTPVQPSNDIGQMIADYMEGTGIDYSTALVHLNID